MGVSMRIEDYDQEVQDICAEVQRLRASISENLISVCNRLVKKARAIDDVNLLGYSYYYLADAYYMISTDYRKFNQNLLKAIEYLQTSRDFEHLARCYNLLGIDALSHGNPELALDFFLTGLKYSEELGEESVTSGLILFNIGQIYFDNGDAKEALSYVRQAYKEIKRNKKDILYYRNLLFCYCFLADCYMELGKKDMVSKNLEGIEQLEQNSEVNTEYFNTIPVLDIKMRGYHYLADRDMFEKYADMLSYSIQYNKHPLDSIEDIIKSCRFLLKIGRIGEVRRIVSNTDEILNELNIPNLKKGHATLKIELYEKLDNKDLLQKALYEYYTYSLASDKEKLENYKFFLNVRNRLSKMEKENRQLLKKAETDSLTGLGNRYGLNNFADSAFEKAFTAQKLLAVEILDVDNFKRFNDSYGHQTGDECLRMISGLIREKCDSNPGIHGFRYGGDEFVIIYEGMTDEEVMGHAIDLRDRVTSLEISGRDGKRLTGITVSQGIRNSIPKETNKLWDFMYAADNALYEVKGHQKGQVALLHKALISQKSLDEAQHS